MIPERVRGAEIERYFCHSSAKVMAGMIHHRFRPFTADR
jgi:hypothetical protein